MNKNYAMLIQSGPKEGPCVILNLARGTYYIFFFWPRYLLHLLVSIPKYIIKLSHFAFSYFYIDLYWDLSKHDRIQSSKFQTNVYMKKPFTKRLTIFLAILELYGSSIVSSFKYSCCSHTRPCND